LRGKRSFDNNCTSFGHSLWPWCAINIEIEAQTPITKTSESFRTEGKALVAIFKKQAAKYPTSKPL